MLNAFNRRRWRAPVTGAVCTIWIAAPVASAQTITVNPGDSLQAAIAAAPAGATIVVNPGTYVGNFDTLGKAITLRSAQGAAATRLAAPASGGSVLRCVSQETGSTVVQGFTIRGGVAAEGAGVLIVGASPRIESCTITGNIASVRGGGLASIGGAPVVRHCTFSTNVSALGGGAFSTGDITLDRCIFEHNAADRGGGAHAEDGSPLFAACQFLDNGGNEDFGSGAGLSLLRADGSITNAVFSGNKQVSGGGLFAEDSSPVLVQCRFSANSSESGNGGGANFIGGAPALRECIFENNVTNFGTGAALALRNSGALVAGCEFRANRSINPGGASGIHIDGGSPAVASCRLLRGDGSAIAVADGSALIAGCLITANEGYSGPGLRITGGTPIVASTTLAGNLSPFGMGGGASVEGGAARLVGCTLAGNRAAYGGGLHHSGGTLAVTGSIIWASISLYGGPVVDSPGGLTITYSCVQEGWPGDGNIAADPMLTADPEAGYRLLAGSPCIDTADNAGFPADGADMDGDGDLSERLPLDLLGRSRYIDDPLIQEPSGMIPPVADMGAVEFQADEEGCPTDWNRDGSISSFDISAFLTAWMGGQTDGPWVTDSNADGRIDSKDISDFLTRWMHSAGGC